MNQVEPDIGHRHAYDNPAMAGESVSRNANPLPSVEVSPRTTSNVSGNVSDVPSVTVISAKHPTTFSNHSTKTVSEVKPVILESTHL